MFWKKFLFILAVISLTLSLWACDGINDTDLDLSEDFFGLTLGAQWLYNESTIMEPGENHEPIAIVTKTIVDVVEAEDEAGSKWFYIENEWQDFDEVFEGHSYGSIIERRNSAYYRKGFWRYDNGDIIAEPFDEGEFLIQETMEIDEYGFWNHELVSKNERVTVPAGVFDTWYFKSVETYNGIVRQISEIWFFPYIGIVKEIFSEEWLEDGEWHVFEGSRLELVEFQPE